MPPISDTTIAVDNALLILTTVCGIVLVGVTITMLTFAVIFRRSKRKTTTQIHGHPVLETVWIIIPTIIFLWLFFVGFGGFQLMRAIPDDAMVIKVTGRQWVWSFYYPESGINTTEMVVPIDTPVRVELTAPPEDVLHSFFIPDFRIKEDVVPGQDTLMWFEGQRLGTYTIFCAEYCGLDHSQMYTTLRVVKPEQYHNWVQGVIAKRFEPLVFEAAANPEYEKFEELAIDGEALFNTFCASCHGLEGDGSGLPGLARNFHVAEDWQRSPRVTDIYRTLVEGIEGTQMRAYPNLSPYEKVALAHHVRSFLESALPEATREAYDELVAEYALDKMQPPTEPIPVERAMELLLKEARIR